MGRKVNQKEFIVNGVQVTKRLCRECDKWKELLEFPSFKTENKKNYRTSLCRTCTRISKRDWNRNDPKNRTRQRKEMENALPKDWSSRDTINLSKSFQFRCAYTNTHFKDCGTGIDHFIALSVGHGGTVKENLLPVSSEVNYSKGNKNPFEWIKQRPDIDYGIFKRSVEYLAALNGLSFDDYKDFVYWCYDNKRTAEEVTLAKEPSLTLWKSVKDRRRAI